MLPLAGGAMLSALAACDTAQSSYTGTIAEESPGRVIVDLSDGISLDRARDLTGLDLEWVDARTADEALAYADVSNVADTVDAIDDLSVIEAVETSLEVQALGWPDYPLLSRQWNFEIVGAETGWRAGAGRGITVAVIDTGVTQVADLNQTTILKGATFVTGIAYESDILPIKVLSGRGFGRSEWVAAGIYEAIEQDADVINLSLGGSNSRVIQNAVKKALDAGIVVVAAAGNSGRRGVGCPANVPGVIAVSATGPDDKLAFYSTWGDEVFMSAPGGNKRMENGGILQDTISSAPEGHAYQEFQGTSMATPHVAGAVAVLLSAGAGSPEQIKEILSESAADLGEAGHDPKYGHGRLSISDAVKNLSLNEHGTMFGVASAAAFALAMLGGLRRRRGRMALVAGLTAGGVFFLPMLPIVPSPTLELLAVPFLNWPSATWSAQWAANPLWLSALLPLALTFFLAPIRFLGPIIAGFTTGIGVHLLHGALTSSLDVAWMPDSFGAAWLGLNGGIALLAALAGAGVTSYQDRKLNKEI
jgi:serine protease